MTTLLVVVGVWLAAALVAALVLGAAMRHAEQGERRRLAREAALELERDSRAPGVDLDDRRSA